MKEGYSSIVRGETQIEDMQSRHVLEKQFVQPLGPSTTPDVLNRRFFEANNESAVTITDFKNGAPGQRIYILGDGFTTVSHNGIIFTNTSDNKLLENNKVYRFTYFKINSSHIWVEDEGGGGGSGPSSLPEFYTTGILTNEVTVNPRPVTDTTYPDLTVNIPASGTVRIFIVTAYIWTSLSPTTGNNARSRVYLDDTRYFTGGNNNHVSYGLYFPVSNTTESGRGFLWPNVPVTVPGDNSAHTISLRYNALGTTASITFRDRFLSVQQVA